MTTDVHNAAIAKAARTVLGPSGCVRKGRSRTWLDDRGWWIGIVEFQPSGFSKGSYLNVAASWLWKPEGSSPLTFDDFSDVGRPWREVSSGSNFDAAALELAGIALQGLEMLRRRHGTVASSADHLSRHANFGEAVTNHQRYHAGVACGLCGRMEDAQRLLSDAIIPPNGIGWIATLNDTCSKLATLTADPVAFRAYVVDRIRENRKVLSLKEIDITASLADVPLG